MLPWTDRAGRFSALKCVTLIGVLVPAAWIALQAWYGWLGPRPVMEAIHQSGLWSVRFLALTLAVTPLRQASRISALVSIRRMLGLSVLAYATLHLGLYIIDQQLSIGHVAAEIASRIYLSIGFAAFCGFVVLGVTSTDRMIARLGSQQWSRLQRFVYLGAVIATVHFFMQSKLDITQPFLMAGIFVLLLGFRVVQRWSGDLGPGQVALVGLFAGVATAVGEAAWYASAGAPVSGVLYANFDFSYTIRPAWFVFGAAMILVAARLLRRSGGEVRPRVRPRLGVHAPRAAASRAEFGTHPGNG